MTTNLDHDDLDALLRRTLDGRAATVTSGPQWSGGPTDRRRSRGPWIAVAAAAVAVLGVAGGAVYLAGSDDHGTPTGGGVPVACRTTLPRAWASALTSTTFTAGGHTTLPDVTTRAGAVLGSWTDGKHRHAVFVEPDGTSRALPDGDDATTADTDGTYAVFASGASGEGANATPVDDIAVVDVVSGSTRHILGGAPTPAGWLVATPKQAAVIQNGVVYWGMRPPGSDDHVTRTDVVSYTVATGRYAIVDRLTGDFSHQDTSEVDRDVRGVGWTGGSVPAKDVPTGLPGFRTIDGHYQPVASDGHSAAWALRGDTSTVHWTDGSGATREFTVPQGDDPDSGVQVSGVSGPYVFLWFNSNAGGEMVLDTRTGAFAPTGFEAGADVDALGDRTLFSDGGANVSTVADLSTLPGLHC